MTVKMEALQKLTHQVKQVYDRWIRSVAEKFSLNPPEELADRPGKPTVLLLGNHSSGKSSFINYLLGQDLQKIGLAPIDDGFTVICYGPTQDEMDGHAAVTHAELPYQQFERFGKDFLTRFRVKTAPADLLKEVTLIDSPGMIDSASRTVGRGYDFVEAVRTFAERADLILFFFDPDKPGTTGETMEVFTQSLAGQEHKLLILLHKVDLFENLLDFARVYGTLCWNLSKIIRTKDMPHIYVTYLPNQKTDRPRTLPLHDFDRAREEVIQQIRRAPIRRTDNLVTALDLEARRVAMIGRVGLEAVRRYEKERWRWIGIGLLIAILTAVAVWGFHLKPLWAIPIGLLLEAGVVFLGWHRLQSLHQRASQDEFLKDCFRTVYSWELAEGNREVEWIWNKALVDLRRLMREFGPSRLPHSPKWLRPFRTWGLKKRIERLERQVSHQIQQLRKQVSTLFQRGI